MKDDSLRVTDSQTGKLYELTIVENTVTAVDFRQIKPDAEDPGFLGTASCRSAVTFIDGDKGILRYGGYPIEELAEKCTFLEVAFLLLFGELPTTEELSEWENKITYHTMIPENLEKFMASFRPDAHPMSIFVSTVAALSTFYPEARDVKNRQQRKMQMMRLIGKVPTIGAHAFRQNLGLPYVYPDNKLFYTGNFLSMVRKMTEPNFEPNPVLFRALDVLFILHANQEHTCSTNTMDSVGSAGTDPYLSVAAAASALAGPLGGGANEEVLRMLDEIDSVSVIPAFLDKVERGESKLTGFGHRLYKNYDPRASIIKKTAEDVFRVTGLNPKLEIALELERIALKDDYFLSRKLYPNVDFYSGIIYQAMGFPTDFFSVLFAIPRTVGWLAQWNELVEDPEHKIEPPRQAHVGQARRDVVPLEMRKLNVVEDPVTAPPVPDLK